MTPLVVSDFWYRVNILFNLLDAAIVLVVGDEKGEEVVVLPFIHFGDYSETQNYNNY